MIDSLSSGADLLTTSKLLDKDSIWSAPPGQAGQREVVLGALERSTPAPVPAPAEAAAASDSSSGSSSSDESDEDVEMAS